MKKYLKIWKQLASLSMETFLANRIDSSAYFAGKIIRFIFFILVIAGIFRNTDNIAGYAFFPALLFFLTFNLIDILSQLVFRGIYFFGYDVKRGNFDFVLLKPVSKLFLVLSRMVDLLDAIFLIPILALVVYVFVVFPGGVSLQGTLLYIILIWSGFLIVTGIHIMVAAFTILNVENDAFLWAYRDAMSITRFPAEIFPQNIQRFFTLVIPVIIVAAFPVRALLGILSWQWMVFAVVYAIGFFALSLLIWKKALKKYSSASS